jgi:hypothetical protein
MKKTGIAWLLTTRGFGSEINNLLYAINYSRKNKLKFYLSSSSWNFKINKGWSDYFETSRDENHINRPKAYFYLIKKLSRYLNIGNMIFVDKTKVPDLKYLLKYLKERDLVKLNLIALYMAKKILFLIQNKDLKSSLDSFNEIREFNKYERKMDPKRFIIKMNEILMDIWKIKPEVLNEIEKMIPNDLTEFVVLHIRRGDKITTGEDQHYTVNDYMKRLMIIDSNIKNIFLMSDDYCVLEELKTNFPHYNYFTLLNSSQKGHNQSSFNNSDDLNKEREAIQLLTEIETAKRSKLFIGSTKSNLFRLIEYMKIENCYDVSDGDCQYGI